MATKNKDYLVKFVCLCWIKGTITSVVSSFSFYIKTLGGCVNTGGRLPPTTFFGLLVFGKNLSFINKYRGMCPLCFSKYFALKSRFLCPCVCILYCSYVCFLKGFIWFCMRCMFVFCFFLLFFCGGFCLLNSC